MLATTGFGRRCSGALAHRHVSGRTSGNTQDVMVWWGSIGTQWRRVTPLARSLPLAFARLLRSAIPAHMALVGHLASSLVIDHIVALTSPGRS